MKKHIRYILPFSFLIAIIFLTWILFFHLELTTDNEKRFAGIFSILGLGFGIFQFWMNEINTTNRKLFDLRYETYKDFIFLIDSILETLNNEMKIPKSKNIHGFVSSLMNQINRIGSSVNMNKDYLFPGLHLKPEVKKVESILSKILKRTDEYRHNIEKAWKEDDESIKDFTESIENMNWHNDVRDELKILHKEKYNFYKALRKYL
ncbi:hypothetical protein GQR60_03235 [Labilibaculum sp. A4]|uniref:hypothetical protein n=1 Tax=Labilibaculum euxinus TaxID=2686357 RepID=UPI000F61DD29|nr:hypothetical protein [Labilibaculum euxinus]MDQ1770435.1 hypothetical protein [Labilibaculum euxinus]MWN75346.1 hypothetical protein [Labilibaculum euxinus]